MNRLAGRNAPGTSGSFLQPEKVGAAAPQALYVPAAADVAARTLQNQSHAPVLSPPQPCGSLPSGSPGLLASSTHPHTGVPGETRTALPSSFCSSFSRSSLPHQIGITEAGCEGRENTLAFQVLAYKKEAQSVFPELCTAAN